MDALSGAGSADGCDSDWCTEVLEKAAVEDLPPKVTIEFTREETHADISEIKKDQNANHGATDRWAWMLEY